jgi:pantetheine-phosphate adenylyltransferase
LKRVIAIYPGSFDPLTNGHLDLIDRASRLFDELIVAVLRNDEKAPLFSVGERREMLEAMIRRWDNVHVDTFEGLLVDYARQVDATAVVRGIRAISDYEYELQMALMNRKLEPSLETVFLTAAESYSYLSSRIVKNIARLGGPVHGMVPELVEERLMMKLGTTVPAKSSR